MNVLAHERTRAQLDALSGTHSGSFVFHGPRGSGKTIAAREFSRRLNCQSQDPAACSSCSSCRRHATASYPDLITLRPEDKPSITIEQVRNLIQALTLSLYRSDGIRVVIIDEAGALTVEAQNALLKLIEEPPPRSLFVLTTDELGALLPTVRSRCETVYFAPVPAPTLAKWLTNEHGQPSAIAATLADAAEGAPGMALTLAATPEAAAELAKLGELAAAVPIKSRFERLLLAKQLIDAKTDLARLSRLIQRHTTAALRATAIDPATGAQRIEALEQFRRHLQANVAPRVALEQLLLGL